MNDKERKVLWALLDSLYQAGFTEEELQRSIKRWGLEWSA